MQLERIRIHGMPGIEEGFELSDLTPGLNIISGPNGIGKTSLCRAVRALLWNEGDADIRAEATCRVGEARVAVSRSRGKANWDVGADVTMPVLPAPQLAGCYTLRIDELLVSGAEDAELVDMIRREMAGGFDLHAVQRLDQFSIPICRLQKEYQTAHQRVEACKRSQTDLHQREKQLPELMDRREAASRAPKQLALLQDAQHLTAARLRLQEIRGEKALFPRGMSRLSNSDGQVLDTLKQQRQETVTALEAAAEERGNAEAAIQRLRLPSGQPLEPAVIDEYRARLDELFTRQQHCETAAAALEGYELCLADARRVLAPTAPPDTPLALGETEVLRADEYLRKHLTLDAAITAGDRACGYLDPGTDLLDPDELTSGIQFLMRWLSVAGDLPKLAFPPARAVLLTLFTVVTLAGVAGGLLIHPAAWLLAPVGAGGLLTVAVGLRFISSAAGEAEAARSQFERLGLSTPKQWTRSEAEGRLAQLLRLQGEARAAECQRQQQKRVGVDLKQQKEKLAELEREWRQYQADSGLDLGIPDLPAVTLRHRLCAYEKAVRDREAANAVLESRRGAHGTLLRECNDFLVLHGAPAGRDHAAAKASFEALSERNRRLQTALELLPKAVKSEARLIPQLREQEEKLESFFSERQVGGPFCTPDSPDRSAHGTAAPHPGALDRRLPQLEQELRIRLERAEDWKLLRDEQRQLLQLCREQRRRLSGHSDLLRLTPEQIERRAQEEQRLTDTLEDLSTDIAKIELEVKAAQSADQLASASAAREKIQERIADGRAHLLYASAAQVLLEEVERDHTASRSGILARASGLFGEFTNHEYTLEVTPAHEKESAAYCAVETATARRKPLKELSGGTRVQLLLAARIAFAEQQEGAKLPLFLDETLKHSDPQRYGQMIACFGQLIRSGRQLFYLTNDPTDCTRIREALETCCEVREFDLARARGERMEWSGVREFVPTALPTIPAPEGRSPDEYRVLLETERFDPWGQLGAVPLFYPLRDRLDLLHRLLGIHHKKVGQWQALGSGMLSAIQITDVERRWIDNRIAVLAAFQEAWVLTRGRQLTPATLQEPEIRLSTEFQRRLGELAQKCDCDARRVISAIRQRKDPLVHRLQNDAQERLEQFAYENGYLGTGECTEEAILAHTVPLAAASSLTASEIAAFVHVLWQYATATDAAGSESSADLDNCI